MPDKHRWPQPQPCQIWKEEYPTFGRRKLRHRPALPVGPSRSQCGCYQCAQVALTAMSSAQGKENTSFLQNSRMGYFWVFINCLFSSTIILNLPGEHDWPNWSLIPTLQGSTCKYKLFQSWVISNVCTSISDWYECPRDGGQGRSRAMGVIREAELGETWDKRGQIFRCIYETDLICWETVSSGIKPHITWWKFGNVLSPTVGRTGKGRIQYFNPLSSKKTIRVIDKDTFIDP